MLSKLCPDTFTLLYDDPTTNAAGQPVENLLPVPNAVVIPCFHYTKQNPGQFTAERTWIGVVAIVLTFASFEIPLIGNPQVAPQLAVQLSDGSRLYVREATVQDSQSVGQMFICQEMRLG